MSESESENVAKSSATPEDSLQPGSSTQATPQPDVERNMDQPEPEPVPSTSGISWKGKMPVNPRLRVCKKKREDWEASIISAFNFIQISREGVQDDSSEDDCGEGEEEDIDDYDYEAATRKTRLGNSDSKQDESAMLELSIDPKDTYPQVYDSEDDPQPSTSYSSPPETGTPEYEQQPVSEEIFIQEDASAPAHASPPPHPARISPLSASVMSSEPFSNFTLPKEMIRHLRESQGINTATILQEKAIPILMHEKDAFIHAGSGSGKTVAFTIPLVHHLSLIKPQVCRQDGVRVLVVVPTMECARRTYQIFVNMVRPTPWIEVGRLGGGDHFRTEKETVRRGVTVLVTTPMRFLDHLRRTGTIFLKNLFCLVVDGLDEIFERGDEKHLLDVITVLEKGVDYLHHPDNLTSYKKKHVEAARQTILVSSSITQEVARFTGLNTTNPMMIDDRLNSPPRLISLPVGNSNDTKKDKKTPLYNQFFMIVPERMKLVALVGFVMWKLKVANERRILIFAGTQTMADYFSELFHRAYGKKDPECVEESSNQLAGLDIYCVSPFMREKDRANLFAKFSRSENGVLFCSDSAVKGMDLPRVDWIIHLHAPTCASDYMARIGMAGPGYQVGSSLVLLLSAEKGYLRELENHDVPLTSIKLRQSFRNLWNCYPPSHTIDDMILEIQTTLEDIVHRSPSLRDRACMAYASWCRLYSSYPQNLKHIFRFTFVHMDNYVRSFGLRHESAFAISRAKKLHSDIRRKPAKKRAPPAQAQGSRSQEPSPKLPSQPPQATAPQAPAQAPVATEQSDAVHAQAGPSGEPSASDDAESKKSRNCEEMELSDDAEEHPEKRTK